MLQPGEKVVCIDPSWGNGAVFPDGPRKGEVYTVREIIHHPQNVGKRDHWFLRLEEVHPAPRGRAGPGGILGPVEPVFHVWKYRRLVAKKTDISILTAMLPPVPGAPAERIVIPSPVELRSRYA